MKFSFTTLIILLFTININAQAQKDVDFNDNLKIIEMKKAGLSKVIIFNSIEDATNFEYDISTNGLKKLSDNKIDDDIIMLLMKKQKNKKENIVAIDGITINKNEYGLFFNDSNEKLKINSHLTQANIKNSGFTSNLKATISNTTSDITIPNNVNVFYFNMNVDENSATNSIYNMSNSISDPNEGNLVKLIKNGNNRELQAGKLGMGGIKVEIPAKYRIAYKVEKVKNNLYKISLLNNLEAGEYGFIFGAINPGSAMKIYDFTVK